MMRTHAPSAAVWPGGAERSPSQGAQGKSQGSALHLVAAHELESLRRSLAAGGLPADLERKLQRLGRGDLKREFIRRHAVLIASLLQSHASGDYPEVRRADCERLLKVLAYVRKEDDAIPDLLPDGFEDDYYEVRAVVTDCAPLLADYKAWRLHECVPRIWVAETPAGWELRWRGHN